MPVEKIVTKLIKNNYHITTAESCTGGMLASTLINVAGVSGVLEEGYITYSNEAKHKLLGVDQQVLSAFGAVSHQVAGQMAIGAANAAKAQVAVSITGIAGPDGGTASKPVGLVYIGCYVNGTTIVTRNHFLGDRIEIRKKSTDAALKLLMELL